LQLLFGPELDDVLLLPSEDDELDELLLSACAAAATATASAAAQNADGFMLNPLFGLGWKPRPMQGSRLAPGMCHGGSLIAVAAPFTAFTALMLAGVLATFFAVLAGSLVGVVEPGRSSS